MQHPTGNPRTPCPRHGARIPTWLLAPVLLWVAAALLLVGGRPAEAAAAPTVTAVSPALGPSAGGTTVTITGTGFVAGAAVAVGGAAATSVTVVSATSITAVTPAGTPGTAVVTVTNADTQSATLSGGFTYQYPPPTAASIVPATGSSAGGTAVTITGTQFRAGATVTFGGTTATNVTVVNATTITATAPARPIGATDVTVANSDAQSATLTAAYTYTAASAPTVTSVSPSSGSVAGATSVTITGTGFVSGATVTFAGVAATSVTVVSPTSITATTPAKTSTGAVAVAVSNPDTQTGILVSGYTYDPRPAPTITTITPATGPAIGGTSVTVTGTGFVTGATLSIGGTSATSTVVVSATTITAVAPKRTAGAGSVVVTNPDGQSATLANGFTSSANNAPTATSISPTSGTTAGGDFVTITGTNFLAGAEVLIGGEAVTDVVVRSSTTITAYTPAHAAGSATVMVVNYDGQVASTSSGFTFTAAAAPTITSLSPAAGPLTGGTTVTITGTGFKAGPTVTVGMLSATVTSSTATSIKITTPPGAAGAADVVVTNADGQEATKAGGFAYQGPAPTVTSITPDGGPLAGGTVVMITGSGFTSGATVTFGGVAATAVTVNGATEVTATVPAGTAAGAVDVAVSNPDGAPGTLTASFTYREAGSPNVASAAPPAGGIVIVVAGTTDVQALVKAQKFEVTAVYLLDVPQQTWKFYIVGAPASVNTLTALKATDIVLLRR